MRSIYSLVFLFFASLASNAQGVIEYLGLGDSDAILVRCTSANPVFRPAGEAGVVIQMKDANPILRKSAPDVPRVTTAIIVDDYSEMDIVINRAEYVDYADVVIAPSKGNLQRTQDPASIPFTYGPEYTQDAFYPGALATLDGAYVQGQYRGQALHFNSVQYNPVTRVLRFYTEIEIAVYPTGVTGANTLPSTVPDRVNLTMNEMYGSRFLNYADQSERYTQIGELGNMLIVSHAQYFDELEPWIQWKKEKGIPVELVDVATVNSVNQIETLVANRYNNDGLTYLVLVGNEDQVPVELVSNSSGVGYCDACYGYISGNDSYTELFVGHLLVHNGNELVPVVDKILEYEKSPYMATDWFSVAMGIGSSEGAGIGDDDEIDWQHQNNIKEDLLDFTYTSVYERYEGNQSASSPTGGPTADASGNPPASSLASVINSGCSLINYTGHGNHDVIATGSFTNSNIYQLTNTNKYPYFIIVGCCVGDYDDDSGSGDTFGEAWIKSTDTENPTGGIGGAFSTVFQSWAPPMEGQDEMNKLIANTGDVNTRHTLGSIHYHGCHSMNDVYGSAGDDMTDTWILMADPSIQLRTAFPTNITATHPATAFFGVNALTVSSATESALVCVSFGGEILATGLIAGGVCNLSFPAVPGPGFLLVTLTSFNTVPYQAEIELLPQDGPYVVNPNNAIDDANGNDNGLADYSESVLLDVVVENIGIEMAFNVVATLTTVDPFVTITDNTHNVGDINFAQTLTLNDAFAFGVANDVPDQHIVVFTITFTDDADNQWTSIYSVVINAPDLECTGTMTIDDSQGNGNGRADSGETILVSFPVINNGHAASVDALIGTLTEVSEFVTVVNATVTGTTIGIGATQVLTFTLQIAANAPDAELFELNFEAAVGAYDNGCSYVRFINILMEDWETGILGQFAWSVSGSSNWFTTGTQPYEGSQCMQSGGISNNQQTILSLNVTILEAGDMSFAYRVSSEGGYDFLRFKVNGTTNQSWSGEIPWSEHTYTLNPGDYVLSWSYEKDVIFNSGTDAAWIDNIILPPSISVGIDELTAYASGVTAYPNPVSDVLVVSSEIAGNESVRLVVQDMSGRVISDQRYAANAHAGRFELNAATWADGVYVVRLIHGGSARALRVVKQ